MAVYFHLAFFVIFNSTIHLLWWIFVVPLRIMLFIVRTVSFDVLKSFEFLRCHQRLNSSGSWCFKLSPNIYWSALWEVLIHSWFLHLGFSCNVESRVNLIRSQRSSVILIAWSQSWEIYRLLGLKSTRKRRSIQPWYVSFHFTHLFKMTLKLPVCDPSRALFSAI